LSEVACSVQKKRKDGTDYFFDAFEGRPRYLNVDSIASALNKTLSGTISRRVADNTSVPQKIYSQWCLYIISSCSGRIAVF
jgi:hypothetical protein